MRNTRKHMHLTAQVRTKPHHGYLQITTLAEKYFFTGQELGEAPYLTEHLRNIHEGTPRSNASLKDVATKKPFLGDFQQH